MKEIGVGMMMRMAAKGIKPRLVVTEADGKWTLRSESTLKTVTYEFTPGVEFNETTADGREVKVKSVSAPLARSHRLSVISVDHQVRRK